ncbi:MAG: DNA-directed polymerase [Acidobacteria bacterium]|nr:DNA-directed polymerase [Acidobacteriota bacterium]
MNSNQLQNAALYLRWVTSHGLSDEALLNVLSDSIQSDERLDQTSAYLVSTRDKRYVLNELETFALGSHWSVFHFSMLKRLRFDSACEEWKVIGRDTPTPAALLEHVTSLGKDCLVVIEDLMSFYRQRLERKSIHEALRNILTEEGLKPTLMLVETPESAASMPRTLADSLRPIQVRMVDLPDDLGFFRRGQQPCLLPYLRAYFKAEKRATNRSSDSNATLHLRDGGHWTTVLERTHRKKKSSNSGEQQAGEKATKVVGWTRLLRADQALDWIKNTLPTNVSKERLSVAIQRALVSWLVPLSSDDSLLARPRVLDRRVETIRIDEKKGEVWSTNGRRPARRVKNFPDALRWPVEGRGLDPIHTPENERAGLTRYLSDGWLIGDDGVLIENLSGSVFGPSASLIPHPFHNEPRRLMLGASLQSRAVDIEASLADPLRPPHDSIEGAGWYPPGRDLRVAFSTCKGWTHEDAIVLSQTAARQLRKRWEERKWRMLIPAIVSRVELDVAPNDVVEPGRRLAKAFIDLFALGFRSHEVEEIGERWHQDLHDGWLEIGLSNSVAPIGGTILEIERHSILDLQGPGAEGLEFLYGELIDNPRGANKVLKWREAITFVVEVNPDVSVGDKLSTRHGIKGVVSRIVDDNHDDLPIVEGEQRAEIVLSPVGVARRSAMGQFCEASSSSDIELPHSGTIFVMRQPQDAIDRCRVRGVHNHEVRGQRYGEMEFWALMAHGASAIAQELLSPERSTASWMYWEAKVGGGDHRKLATRALNRYLSVIDAKIETGSLVQASEPEDFSIHCGNYGELKDAWDLLNDNEAFASKKGGLGFIQLDKAITINLEGKDRLIEKLYVLPPWLRPEGTSATHELTKAYRSLLVALAFGKPYRKDVERCVAVILDQHLGVHAFLRREVLGRRLTRSARAVIVPRPDLRIDQIMIPRRVAETLFDGLASQSKDIVLVNRNPTLHRRGLIALRPVIDETDTPVFGLPLGILKVLGADFDGDQVNIVALETDEALSEAKNLLPGSCSLRIDPLRRNTPAFPLLQELSTLEAERLLARKKDDEGSQESWSEQYRSLLQARIESLQGWPAQLMKRYAEENRGFRHGFDQETWLKIADERMEYVYTGVRKKGRYGGVLRREFYRQTYKDEQSFWRAIEALQAVTERLTQSVLTTKTGEGASLFDSMKYFENPQSEESKKSLTLLEPSDPLLDPDQLAAVLGDRRDPLGLLAWLANPTTETLLASLSDPDGSSGDPRIAWFLK